MADDPNGFGLNNEMLHEYYLPRPRIDSILDQLTQCKLVYVIAGAGYGKTQAVRHYIKRQKDAVVRWIHLTESDNVLSRYWENLTFNVAIDNPELAAKFREVNFPETQSDFRKFTEIIKNREHRAQKTFLVFDNFHLIHTEQALSFAERCAHMQIPGACVIIISRKEPEINAVSLFAAGNAGALTEDELRFTESEIVEFLRASDTPVSAKNIPKVLDASKGWVLAVKLLSLVIKRTPGNIDHALDTMKQNVFKLLEAEAWGDFPKEVQKILAGLSLLSDLPLTPLRGICDDSALIQSTPRLTSFMWFDSFAGDYRVHPLYLEFLQTKADVLSEKEKRDFYKLAVRWCFENGFNMDAIKYYAKLGQYDEILKNFLKYPFKMPRDACEYYLDIIENLGDAGDGQNDIDLLLLRNMFVPLLLVGASRHEEAMARSFDVIRQWEHSDAPFANNLLSIAYSNLAYVDMYVCPATYKYDFPEYMKKAVEYYKSASAPLVEVSGAFSIADVRSFACFLGENADLQEFDRFLEATREAAVYIAQTPHGMYCGFADLAACEIAFFKNQIEAARNFAYESIIKAREKGQYSIAMAATRFLLRIAVYEGDSTMVKVLLKQLGDYLDIPEFWNRQLLYDLYTGMFYAQTRLPMLAPSWLTTDEKEAASELHIPVWELIVGAKLHIAAKQYNQALTALCNAYPRHPHHRFLLGELTLSLLLAVTRLNTGDVKGAMLDFAKAYRLSFEGVFEIVFIELGREMHPLVAEALKQEDIGIPESWLGMIDRKASIYAKKAAVVANMFADIAGVGKPGLLSDREREVLSDLYHGLSREEIAVNRYLSINTVKKVLQSIYIKLDAGNNVDAVRNALERGLI